MPRKQHAYHYIYKTTCKVTEKFYIGMHSTSNLEDGYIGSGKRLWNSINKYGRENHSIEILEWFLDRKTLGLREKELVNSELLKDSKCMNLKLGGEYSPGTYGKKYSDESRKKMSEWKRPKELGEKISAKLKDRKFSEEHCKAISEGKTGTHYTEEHVRNMSKWERTLEYRTNVSNSLKDYKHSEESKANMRKPKSETGKQNMRKPKEKSKCPHCGLEGGLNQLTRWHFNNCKTLS